MELIEMNVTVIDFDRLGAKGVASTIANGRYPNDCIHPDVNSTKVYEIGEWSDDHPLNRRSTCDAELKRILKPDSFTIHSYLIEHVSGEAIYAKTIMAATDQITQLGWDDKDITWTWLYKKDE